MHEVLQSKEGNTFVTRKCYSISTIRLRQVTGVQLHGASTITPLLQQLRNAAAFLPNLDRPSPVKNPRLSNGLHKVSAILFEWKPIENYGGRIVDN